MTAPITPDERADLRARSAAATAGMWGHYGPLGGDARRYISRDHDVIAADVAKADADFIIAARTAVPRLLDALDTAEADLDGFASAVSQWKHRALDAGAEVARLLAERTAAHADDATCASCTHEYVADLERRVEEAEAEAARPAPVWDEDTVTEAVENILERDWHGEYTCECTTDRCPTVPCPTSTPVYVTSARAVLAVVREHLPVRPDRETIADVLIECGTWCGMADVDHEGGPCPACIERARGDAHAVLDLWPGESRATVQAEALREAAVTARRCWTRSTNLPDPGDPEVAYSFDRWLEVRADRIEKGDTP